MNIEEAINRIIENRGLTYHKPDSLSAFETAWRPYHDKCYWYVNTFDVDALEQLIPSDLKIMMTSSGPTRTKGLVTWYTIYPINRDLIHPLRRMEILYEVSLVDKSDKNLQYRGLYSADKRKWVIEPMKGRGGFGQTAFSDFIGTSKLDYGFGLINIRTQEKYKADDTENFSYSGLRGGLYYNVWNK